MSAPAVFYPGNSVSMNVKAGEAVKAGDAVKVSGPREVQASSNASTACIGIAQFDVPADAVNRAVTIHRVGIQTVIAGTGGITYGSPVVCAASGTVRDAVALSVNAGAIAGDQPTAVIGKAVTTATAGNPAEISLS